MKRALAAVCFASAVVVAQALACLGTLITAGLVGALAPALGVVMVVGAGPLALGVASAAVHRLLSVKLALTTSVLATILLALGGLALGSFIGSMFEKGHMVGGGWQSLLGGALGSFSFVCVGTLRDAQATEPIGLGLRT